MSIFNHITYDENTKTAKFSLQFPIEYAQESRVFYQIYQPESMIIFVGKPQKPLKPKKDRICRFCGKKMPDVKFKNDAHFIPEFLGNKDYLSDFECDSCNHKFGDYENEFANFLGLSRILSMHKGKKGIPTFKSPDKNLIVREEDGILNLNEVNSNVSIEQDVNNETMTIKAGRHPYCSISVFKSLVKIGLSMVPEESIDEYSDTIDYLLNSEKVDNSLISIVQHIVPGPYNIYPIALSYKIRPHITDKLVPTRTFVIYFHNRMIQFFLPFNKNEETLNQANSKVRVATLPPLIDQDWYNKYGKPQMNIINLNHYEKVRDRTESIQIKHFKKENKNAL